MFEAISQNSTIISEIITILAPIGYFMFWSHRYTNNRIDETNKRLDQTNKRLDQMILTQHAIMERLARMEGMMMNKDCCMIKDDRIQKKLD